MQIIDYNGTGRWSQAAVLERYAAYARQMQVMPLRDLRVEPLVQGERSWIDPVMHNVIAGIEAGDRACIEIGVECIVENQWLRFGRTIKSSTARSLRRSELTPEQANRLRCQILQMLLDEHIPGHYRDYARLVRKIGLADWWPRLESGVNRDNPHVMRFFDYFETYLRPTE